MNGNDTGGRDERERGTGSGTRTGGRVSEVGVLCRVGGQEELERAHGWGERSVVVGPGKGVVGR